MLNSNKNVNYDSANTDRYLIFRWQQNHFAISINYVKEVMEYEIPTPLPGYPNLLRGIISLRGEICPVLDLREILIKDVKNVTKPNKLIVIQYQGFKATFDVDQLCGIDSFNEINCSSQDGAKISKRTFKTDKYRGSILSIPSLWDFAVKLIQQ
tara:strand:- start:1051 stop:1512 length:462 start_codon:yes stop_codon:yes gene_type:complete